MSDVSAPEAWVECPTCEGHGGQVHVHQVAVPSHAPGCMGETCERTCPVPVPQPVEEFEPCPHCVNGLVPPDGMVEAAAKGAWESGRLPSSGRWEDEWAVNKSLLVPPFRAALVAARRWLDGEGEQ